MTRVLLLLLCCWPMGCWANFTDSPAEGFHWYTQPAQSVPTTRPAPTPATTTVNTPALTPSQRLHLLTQVTRDTLSTALLQPNEANTTRYMRAQQFWAQQDQRFVRAWQQSLLDHPELDYSLRFPSNNQAIAVRNDEHNALVAQTLQGMAKHYGLLFFYQGRSSLCQKFASQLMPFVQAHHFAMISVTTDHQPIIGLPNPKDVPIATLHAVLGLQARYLPALFLVNLHTHQMKALSYGFLSLTDLKERFVDVLTDFQRYSFTGIGETHP